MIQKTILPLISILFIYLVNCIPQIDKGQKISKTYFGVLNFSKTEQKKVALFCPNKGSKMVQETKAKAIHYIKSEFALLKGL